MKTAILRHSDNELYIVDIIKGYDVEDEIVKTFYMGRFVSLFLSHIPSIRHENLETLIKLMNRVINET